MNHLVLNKIKSPTNFASLIYCNINPDLSISEQTLSDEESIFSPKKIWFNKESKFTEIQYPENSKFPKNEEFLLTQDEEFDDFEIFENQQQELSLMKKSLPFEDTEEQKKFENLQKEIDQKQKIIQQETKLNQNSYNFEEEYSEVMIDFERREFQKQMKIKRRRKIRRANYKMKAKVKKLANHWIARKELFPNVFKITQHLKEDQIFSSWEYQDYSKKFVLPDKE